MPGEFQIKPDDAVLVTEDALRRTVTYILTKTGVPTEDAELATDVMVRADLRGVDSHGVSNLLRVYVERYRDGILNPRPNWRIIRESPATATIDSDGGLGTIIAPKAMEIAIAKAEKTGVGMVSIGNARHLGMAAYHAMLPLKHDMIGVCMTSCPPTVLPTFAGEPRIGTNPIAFAAPAENEAPFVFDGATSVIPDNKVRIARRLGIDLPGRWIGDSGGKPILEPAPAPSPHRLLPLGSLPETGSHKGYSLACMVEILCAFLSGSTFGFMREWSSFAHYVAAYKIEAFTEVKEFKTNLDEFIRTLNQTPPIEGQERVLVAGQLEWETEQRRSAEGVPLHKEVVAWFTEICTELDIPDLLSNG